MASNGIDYTIIVDAAAVEAMLADAALLLPRVINSTLLTASSLVKDELRKVAPVGVAGSAGAGLKGSINYAIDPALHTSRIGPDNTVAYADAVETGSRPHMPPAGPDSALAQWCEMKGLNVWAVAKSIARKGTQPHPYIVPTYVAVSPVVGGMFSAGVAQYLKELQVA